MMKPMPFLQRWNNAFDTAVTQLRNHGNEAQWKGQVVEYRWRRGGLRRQGSASYISTQLRLFLRRPGRNDEAEDPKSKHIRIKADIVG